MKVCGVRLDNCLICCGRSVVASGKPKLLNGLVDNDNQLIFLLTNILEVPNSFLGRLLGEHA